MYRFIDSNHHPPPQNNFDENTLTAKKYFKIILVFDLVLIRWHIPPLDEGMSYTQVSAGCVHTVLLRSDGSAVTFGGNDVEQCDIPSCAMWDLQKWLIIFLGCFLFLGLMRCESYNANKFNIMSHVCSLVVMSESPLNFKLQQERIKTCNSKPIRSLRNYSKDLGDALHSSKIKVGSCQNHPTRP